MSKPKILLVIPAFNEAERLPVYLDTLLPALQSFAPANIHCLVVDDGSKKNHLKKLQQDLTERRKNYMIDLLPLAVNQGKGGAVLAGWRHVADADYYGFLDADGAIPADEVLNLVGQVMDSDSSVFASRIVLLGKKVERKALRHYVGRGFAFLVGTFINPSVYDSQCGMKIIPAAHLRRVLPALTGHRFAFDIELLAALDGRNLPVREIPINWRDVPGSKISLLRDSSRMLRSILQINQKIKHGYYRK